MDHSTPCNDVPSAVSKQAPADRHDEQLQAFVARMHNTDAYTCHFCHRRSCVFTSPTISAVNLTLNTDHDPRARPFHTAEHLWKAAAVTVATALASQAPDTPNMQLVVQNTPTQASQAMQTLQRGAQTLQRSFRRTPFRIQLQWDPPQLAELLANPAWCDQDADKCLARLRARRRRTGGQRSLCCAGAVFQDSTHYDVVLDESHAACLQRSAHADGVPFVDNTTGETCYKGLGHPPAVCTDGTIQTPAHYWCQECAEQCKPTQSIWELQAGHGPCLLPNDCATATPRCVRTQTWNLYGRAAYNPLTQARRLLAAYTQEVVTVRITMTRQGEQPLFSLEASRVEPPLK